MPKVSIILPLYNSEKFIEECVKSLLNQTFKDYELIILDDRSTDRTREILKKMDIIFIKNESNLGFSRNINKGINKAKGEYIMIADHDMVYEKNYLKKMLLEKRDIMAGKCYYYKAKNKIRSFGITINLLTGKTKVIGRDEEDHNQFNYIKEIESDAAGTLIINKKVFGKIYSFDESFNKYYVDIDFCLRARKAGFKIFLSKAKCWHKKEEKEIFNEQQLKDYYKDKKLFLKKHSPYYPFSLIPIKIKNIISK